jgi:hypothetical protein
MGHSYLEQSIATHSGLGAQQSHLHPPELVPTGFPLADHGTACNPMDPAHEAAWRNYVNDECYLAPNQRREVVATLQRYVSDARQAYLGALAELRVEQLLKKDSGSFMFDLLLDVIGLAVMTNAANALKHLRGAPAALAEYGEVTAATMDLQRVSDKRIELIARQAVTTGKKLVPKPGDPTGDPTTGTVAYLDLLRRGAAIEYQQLGQLLPAGTTDIELVILAHSFKAENGHTTADYKKLLSEKLQLFDDSGVGKLGVSWNPHKRGLGIFDFDQIDRKLFWVQLPLGKRLAIYKRGHIDQLDGPLGSLLTRDAESRPFHFERYVPEDLVDTAVQMHGAKWGEPPGDHLPNEGEWAALAGAAP